MIEVFFSAAVASYLLKGISKTGSADNSVKKNHCPNGFVREKTLGHLEKLQRF